MSDRTLGSQLADSRDQHRLELADGRVVDVLAFTIAAKVPGRYRIRDATGRVEVVSVDDVVGEIDAE